MKKAIFNNWLLLGKKISSNVASLNSLICPNCGANTIDFQYVGDVESRIGYKSIWCNTCNHGIHISRVKIPDEANMLSFDEKDEVIDRRIPNFIEVTPED